MAAEPIATVAALRRYPVKSMRGEKLERVEVAEEGIAGDRSVTLIRNGGKLMTARVEERMLGVLTTLGADGGVLVDGHPWDSAEAAAIATDIAGDGARFEAAEGGHRYDDTPILITTDGMIEALGEMLGDPGLDPLRFRANIHLAGVAGRTELDWVGRRLRIGGVTIKVEWPCERCKVTTIDPDPGSLAIDADVLRTINAEFDRDIGLCCTITSPGPLALGDEAFLV